MPKTRKIKTLANWENINPVKSRFKKVSAELFF